MKKQDIEVGETYLFVGSDSPKRAQLAGQPFTVSSIEKVYRKVSYRHKKRSMKVTRFFNEEGAGARAEELEPLPAEGFFYCPTCTKWYHDYETYSNVICSTGESYTSCKACEQRINTLPAKCCTGEAADEIRDRGHGFCPKCESPLNNWGAASDGDGDIYDEIGCDSCQEVIRKEHASYCTCVECDPYGLKAEGQEIEDEENKDHGPWETNF